MMRRTKTWVSQPINSDTYDVYVCAYSWDDRHGFPVNVRSEHLTPDGWVEHPEGAQIEPVLRFPGYLAAHIPWLDAALAKALREPDTIVEAIEVMLGLSLPAWK